MRSNERSGKDIRSDIDDNVGMWNVTWLDRIRNEVIRGKEKSV